MFQSFEQAIQDLGFLYVHTGTADDGGNRIYAAAAIRIDKNGKRSDFESRIRYSAFSETDRYLSNLTKAEVQDAPPIGTVAKQLKEFCKDLKFLFLYDDRGGIDAVLPHLPEIRFVDLDFAAQFFLPQIDAHTPKRIAEFLNGKPRERISFSAREMADLSVAFTEHLCGEILNDSRYPHAASIRFYLSKSNTLFGRAFCHVIAHFQEYFGGLFNPKSLPDTAKWFSHLERADSPRRNKEKGEKPVKKIADGVLENLYQTLGTKGGYAFRPEQLSYAHNVAHALNDGAVLAIEAGTGTGKTLGYLLPLMEFLRQNPHIRAAVSTYTKSLQEQIFRREIRFVREVFGDLYGDLPVALLKGKSSYICATKLGYVYDDGLLGKPLLAWLYLMNIVFNYRTAEADAAGEKVKAALNPYLARMRTSASARTGCTRKHVRCPAQVVTAEAADARLVITNHHKLVLLDQDGVLSELFNNCVIDEANHFEDAVRGALTVEINSREMAETGAYLLTRGKALLKKAGGEIQKKIKKALEAIDGLNGAIDVFKEALAKTGKKKYPGAVHELPCNHDAYMEGHIRTHIGDLQESLTDIGAGFKWARDEEECRRIKIAPRAAQRIRLSLDEVEEYRSTLKTIDLSVDAPNRVASFRLFTRHWTLTVQDVEVDGLIEEHIHKRKQGVIYTAATLCHKGKFDAFCTITGMNRNGKSDITDPEPRPHRFAVIPSPFPKNFMEMVIPKSAESGKYANKAKWLESAIKIIPELILENRGRTLVLFASYEDMEAVAAKVGPAIEQARFPLLIQQRGMPTANLCDEFRTVKESVLFGVDSFWYGVDFKGDTLTQVIITRIPYPSPSEPIQQARKKMLPESAYWDRYRYDTDIKMRQGIGRLIRSHMDRGKVVILDSRYRP